MGKAPKPLRRQNVRSEVSLATIKGLLTCEGSDVHEPFLVWDLSDNGLGLWVSNKLVPGQKVKVTIAKPWLVVLNCEVRWCNAASDMGNGPNDALGDGFKAGLRVLDNLQRLEALHRSLCDTQKNFRETNGQTAATRIVGA